MITKAQLEQAERDAEAHTEVLKQMVQEGAADRVLQAAMAETKGQFNSTHQSAFTAALLCFRAACDLLIRDMVVAKAKASSKTDQEAAGKILLSATFYAMEVPRIAKGYVTRAIKKHTDVLD